MSLEVGLTQNDKNVKIFWGFTNRGVSNGLLWLRNLTNRGGWGK